MASRFVPIDPVRRALLLSCCCAATLGVPASSLANSVVAIGDEWLLSDDAFNAIPGEAQQLAANLASLLGGGGPASFLAYSNAGTAFGASLTSALTTAGHSFVMDASFTLTLDALTPYDAVFLAGGAGASAEERATLQAYVAQGGSLVVMAGTGAFGGPQQEAAAWNPLLASFGLAFGDVFFDVAGTVTVPVVSGSHALQAGLTSVRWGYGQTAYVLEPPLQGAAVAISGSFDGTGGSGVSGVQPLVAVFSLPEPLTVSMIPMGLAAIALRRRSLRR